MAKRKDLIINQTDDDYDAKNKANTVVLEGINNEDIKSMKIVGENDLFIIETDDRIITIDNYKKIKYILPQDSLQPINIIKNALVDYTDLITDTDRKKLKLAGTIYNDKINALGYDVPTTGKNKDKGLTINSGYGNDEITGSLGNDTITGGAGVNTIIVSGDFGKDTVILTKGETLLLDLSDYEFNNIDNIDFDASDRKNLILTIKDNMNLGGTLILKNYTKRNLEGTKVLLNLGDEDNMIDLNTLDIFEYDEDNFSNGVFKGTRFSETIDASGFTTALGKKNKGVTIDGGAGYNIIIGTNGFNDTIKGGNDGNEITAGDGNKKITTGSGDDKITITGDGIHTIKAGNGKNNIKVAGDGKNTIITGKDNDIISVESYEGTNTIKAGGGNNEVTVKGDANTNVQTGKDNDVINISSDTHATTTISAGKGENTINIDNSDVFGNVIIMEEKVNAVNTVCFSTEFDSDYSIVKEGKDLVIYRGYSPIVLYSDEINPLRPEEISSLRLKNYYANNSKHAQYKFKIGENIMSIDDLVQITGGIYITGKGTIRGSNNNDNICITGRSSATVYAGDGNDFIYRNDYGNSKIYSGKGNDFIKCYGDIINYFYEGDGYDTIFGCDDCTIVFPSKTDVRFTYKFLEGHAISTNYDVVNDYCNEGICIYYGNNDDYVLSTNGLKNTYVQIGNKKRSLESLLKETKLTTRDGENNKYYATNNSDSYIKFEHSSSELYALEGNDAISVLGSSNTINAGEGNDVIYAESSNTLLGGAGNDIYDINPAVIWQDSWNNLHDKDIDVTINIFDESGDNDVLRFFKPESLIVNIHSDKTYDDMLQMNFANKKINIDKYFSTGKIEKIIGKTLETKTMDSNNQMQMYLETCYLDMSNFETVREAVAGWLAEKGYADVNAAIEADAGNLTILTGAEYFGALEWKPIEG